MPSLTRSPYLPATDKAISEAAEQRSVLAGFCLEDRPHFIWLSAPVRDMLRMVKHQSASKPSIQMTEPSLRSLFLSQPGPALKTSPFKWEAVERRCLVSAANVACGIIIGVPVGADVSHLFSGTRSQMSARINAESAHRAQGKPLQKKAFQYRRPMGRRDRQSPWKPYLLTHHPTSHPL